MATTFNAPDMTSGAAVKSIHAGVNSKVVNHNFGTVTRSGGAIVNVTPLPAGARVQGGTVYFSANPGDTAAAVVSVYDSLGNTYMLSTAYAQTLNINGPDLGARLTGSANLIVAITNVGGAPAPTASSAMTVSVQYLAEDDGD